MRVVVAEASAVIETQSEKTLLRNALNEAANSGGKSEADVASLIDMLDKLTAIPDIE